MENKTIHSILDFLNQMEIYKILTGIEAGIYNILRNDIINEYKEGNIDKLFEIVSSFDRVYIDYLEKRSYFDKTLLIDLRNKILTAYMEKIKNVPTEDQHSQSICSYSYQCVCLLSYK